MGRKARIQPKHIGSKLAFIRELLSMTQDELYAEMVYPRNPSEEERRIGRGSISDYEHGRRAPSLIDVLCYVKMVNRLSRHQMKMDDLVDDKVRISDIFARK